MKIRLYGALAGTILIAQACTATQDLGENDPRNPKPDSGPGDATAGDGSTPPGDGGTPPAQDAGFSLQAGLTFTQFPFDKSINTMWGASGSDIWAIGNEAFHYDGTKWSLFPTSSFHPGFGNPPPSLSEIWGTSSISAWGVGPIIIYRWNGSDWVSPPKLPGERLSLYTFSGVWAENDNNVWVSGSRYINGTNDLEKSLFQFKDDAWTTKYTQPDGYYYSIWGSDAQHLWIGGDNHILAYDGQNFVTVASGLSVRVQVIRGTSANDVWAFGTAGFISHWDGKAWKRFPIAASIDFRAAFIRSANDIYAVGKLANTGSAIAHWDGASWTHGAAQDGAILHGVWGGPNEVWALGDKIAYRGK
ncbi:hypothetical protein LVJ94_48910 [Pendulispora rubella]|uniref:Uncharacterized protein n=1 Tax=Pendulispora rubella TaxID=2741070 RepID=A0ABZ2L1S8_9BACT